MNETTMLMKALFDEGELICSVPSVYGIELRFEPTVEDLFYAINPLHTIRRDEFVTAYRNILCEFDFGSIEEQIEMIKKSGIPYTALVYSGGKSIHMLISLETPLENKAAYKALVKRIYRCLPGADKANSNPSRLSRLPGRIRPDTGKPQRLIELGYRISNDYLESHLSMLEAEEENRPPRDDEETVDMPEIHGYRNAKSGHTLDLLMFGAEPGTRNRRSFAAACDLIRCGYTPDEILNMISRAVDLPISELKTCIASAAKTVRSKNG